MSISIIEKLKAAVATLEKEAVAFTDKGNNAAGTRSRGAAQEIKVLAQEWRNFVSETKAAKAAK